MNLSEAKNIIERELNTLFFVNLKEATEFATLKKNKIPLTPEEREEVMKAKAVWHQGKDGKPSPAVWKSKSKDGKITYCSNTHRIYQSSSTLKGAIKKFFSVVKETS
jgi:hypothetical protein